MEELTPSQLSMLWLLHGRHTTKQAVEKAILNELPLWPEAVQMARAYHRSKKDLAGGKYYILGSDFVETEPNSKYKYHELGRYPLNKWGREAETKKAAATEKDSETVAAHKKELPGGSNSMDVLGPSVSLQKKASNDNRGQVHPANSMFVDTRDKLSTGNSNFCEMSEEGNSECEFETEVTKRKQPSRQSSQFQHSVANSSVNQPKTETRPAMGQEASTRREYMRPSSVSEPPKRAVPRKQEERLKELLSRLSSEPEDDRFFTPFEKTWAERPLPSFEEFCAKISSAPGDPDIWLRKSDDQQKRSESARTCAPNSKTAADPSEEITWQPIPSFAEFCERMKKDPLPGLEFVTSGNSEVEDVEDVEMVETMADSDEARGIVTTSDVGRREEAAAPVQSSCSRSASVEKPKPCYVYPFEDSTSVIASDFSDDDIGSNIFMEISELRRVEGASTPSTCSEDSDVPPPPNVFMWNPQPSTYLVSQFRSSSPHEKAAVVLPAPIVESIHQNVTAPHLHEVDVEFAFSKNALHCAAFTRKRGPRLGSPAHFICAAAINENALAEFVFDSGSATKSNLQVQHVINVQSAALETLRCVTKALKYEEVSSVLPLHTEPQIISCCAVRPTFATGDAALSCIASKCEEFILPVDLLSGHLPLGSIAVHSEAVVERVLLACRAIEERHVHGAIELATKPPIFAENLISLPLQTSCEISFVCPAAKNEEISSSWVFDVQLGSGTSEVVQEKRRCKEMLKCKAVHQKDITSTWAFDVQIGSGTSATVPEKSTHEEMLQCKGSSLDSRKRSVKTNKSPIKIEECLLLLELGAMPSQSIDNSEPLPANDHTSSISLVPKMKTDDRATPAHQETATAQISPRSDHSGSPDRLVIVEDLEDVTVQDAPTNISSSHRHLAEQWPPSPSVDSLNRGCHGEVDTVTNTPMRRLSRKRLADSAGVERDEVKEKKNKESIRDRDTSTELITTTIELCKKPGSGHDSCESFAAEIIISKLTAATSSSLYTSTKPKRSSLVAYVRQRRTQRTSGAKTVTFAIPLETELKERFKAPMLQQKMRRKSRSTEMNVVATGVLPERNTDVTFSFTAKKKRSGVGVCIVIEELEIVGAVFTPVTKEELGEERLQKLSKVELLSETHVPETCSITQAGDVSGRDDEKESLVVAGTPRGTPILKKSSLQQNKNASSDMKRGTPTSASSLRRRGKMGQTSAPVSSNLKAVTPPSMRKKKQDDSVASVALSRTPTLTASTKRPDKKIPRAALSAPATSVTTLIEDQGGAESSAAPSKAPPSATNRQGRIEAPEVCTLSEVQFSDLSPRCQVKSDDSNGFSTTTDSSQSRQGKTNTPGSRIQLEVLPKSSSRKRRHPISPDICETTSACASGSQDEMNSHVPNQSVVTLKASSDFSADRSKALTTKHSARRRSTKTASHATRQTDKSLPCPASDHEGSGFDKFVCTSSPSPFNAPMEQQSEINDSLGFEILSEAPPSSPSLIHRMEDANDSCATQKTRSTSPVPKRKRKKNDQPDVHTPSVSSFQHDCPSSKNITHGFVDSSSVNAAPSIEVAFLEQPGVMLDDRKSTPLTSRKGERARKTRRISPVSPVRPKRSRVSLNEPIQPALVAPAVSTTPHVEPQTRSTRKKANCLTTGTTESANGQSSSRKRAGVVSSECVSSGDDVVVVESGYRSRRRRSTTPPILVVAVDITESLECMKRDNKRIADPITLPACNWGENATLSICSSDSAEILNALALDIIICEASLLSTVNMATFAQFVLNLLDPVVPVFGKLVDIEPSTLPAKFTTIFELASPLQFRHRLDYSSFNTMLLNRLPENGLHALTLDSRKVSMLKITKFVDTIKEAVGEMLIMEGNSVASQDLSAEVQRIITSRYVESMMKLADACNTAQDVSSQTVADRFYLLLCGWNCFLQQGGALRVRLQLSPNRSKPEIVDITMAWLDQIDAILSRAQATLSTRTSAFAVSLAQEKNVMSKIWEKMAAQTSPRAEHESYIHCKECNLYFHNEDTDFMHNRVFHQKSRECEECYDMFHTLLGLDLHMVGNHKRSFVSKM
ncbi:hypothetical protein Q1695_002854 [Nippostrongylus brasiliensis]|nr:hypothetical protein Q1695_002854 [Nippostrongylus brasiliensis]